MAQYTIDLGEVADGLLAKYAAINNVTKGEVLRRALATYVYLLENGPEVGLKVSITDNDDTILKDVCLP